MPFPPQDEVRAILRDFELRLRAILEDAWQDWLEMNKRASLSPRSRASIVFDFIRLRALAEFDGDPNIRALPKGQTIRFLFRNQVLVRFKKANSSGLGSNIETQAVIEFVDQQIMLFDLPDIYRIEICYRLDKMATHMTMLAVTARHHNQKLWAYELERGATATVVPLPPRSGPPDTGLPQVRIKKPADKPEDRGE